MDDGRFTPDNAKEQSAKSEKNFGRSAHKQAIEWQLLLLDAGRKAKTKPSELSQLCRAWCDVEERKRVIKGYGAPKPVEAVNNRPRKKSSSSAAVRPSEPTSKPIDDRSPKPEPPPPQDNEEVEGQGISLAGETVPTPPTGEGANGGIAD